MSLRADNNAKVVRLEWTFFRLFTGRYAVQSGRRTFEGRWKKPAVDSLHATQVNTPVPVARHNGKALWLFHSRFYWDDDGLDADDVKALILDRERRQRQKLNTAHSLMRAEEAGRPTRAPITTELRRAVFERDGGRCVECGSNFALQYDHILAVARGGATTVENLQILCADCNRHKSDSL
jgi:5-methylcytosine-specific restriction endonuclease McrA